MMSLFLTKELEKGDEEVGFFFCDRQDEKHNGAAGILRGLIYQILRRKPEMTTHFAEIMEDPESRKRFDIILDSPPSLWTFFTRIIHDSRPSPLYCILDSFGECSEDAIRFTIQKIGGQHQLHIGCGSSQLVAILLAGYRNFLVYAEIPIKTTTLLRIPSDILGTR